MYRIIIPLIVFLIIILSFSASVLADEIADKFEKFIDVEKRMHWLAEHDKTDLAFEILHAVRDKFPDDEYQILDWLIYFNKVIRKHDECLNLWSEGHRKGYFFGIYPSDPQYQVFYRNYRFINIAEKDAQLLEKALEKSKTIYEIRTPDNYSPEKTYPILFALHGGWGTLWHSKKYWQSDKIFKEYIIVYMQSYVLYDYNSYGWDANDPRGRKYFQEIFEDIKKEYSIDTTCVIVGGISAGGLMSFDISFNNILPVTGFIGLCSGIPENADIKLVKSAKEHGLKAYLIAGENDFLVHEQNKMEKLFIEADLPYQYHIIKDLVHEYPPDFSDWIDKALEFFQMN